MIKKLLGKIFGKAKKIKELENMVRGLSEVGETSRAEVRALVDTVEKLEAERSGKYSDMRIENEILMQKRAIDSEREIGEKKLELELEYQKRVSDMSERVMEDLKSLFIKQVDSFNVEVGALRATYKELIGSLI